jgi:hypothetical protein
MKSGMKNIDLATGDSGPISSQKVHKSLLGAVFKIYTVLPIHIHIVVSIIILFLGHRMIMQHLLVLNIPMIGINDLLIQLFSMTSMVACFMGDSQWELVL